MKRFPSILIRPLCCFLLLLSLPCGLCAQRSLAHHRDDGFTNTDPNYKEPSFTKLVPYLFGRFTDLFSRPKADVAFTYNDGSILRQNRPYTITWIGHTTLLIQIEGKNIISAHGNFCVAYHKTFARIAKSVYFLRRGPLS